MNQYRLKIALRGVSPMIQRRIRVTGKTSLADLHHIIQIAMGWDNDYLHCFHIYGKDYGIAYEGGMSFSDNPRTVFLDDFGFDTGDRFTYTYNFFNNWLNDIRIEKIDVAEDASPYVPFCLSGQGRQGDQTYHKMDEVLATLKFYERIVYADPNTPMSDFRDWIEEVEAIRFNRKTINQCLDEKFSV
jgi:hypothetical protein